MHRHIATAIFCTLLLAGCAPGPEPIPLPIPVKAKPAKPSVNQERQQLEKDIQDKVLDSTNEQYEAQREALRDLRKGGQINPEQWPGCAGLEKAYVSYIEKADTLVAIQEALVASEVDDHVICDTPTILPAAKIAAATAQQKFMGSADPAVVVDYLLNNPARRKMDACWLDGLRKARQESVDYDKSFAVVQAGCSGAPAAK